MQEKEINILVLSSHIVRLKITKFTTVRQIIADLEKLGLKGFALGAEPKEFLFMPGERIFSKLDGEVVYAFPCPEEGGDKT
jgi:hypothetical protein